MSPSCFENPSFNNRSADRLFWQMSAFTHSFFEDALWEMSQFPVQNSTAFIIVQITNFTLFSYNFHSCAIYFSLCWKSFGLLTTKLHLFSDPCSLSLLQELRNKPFIRSSVTLCSKMTSRLETEKHWRWWCGSGILTRVAVNVTSKQVADSLHASCTSHIFRTMSLVSE